MSSNPEEPRTSEERDAEQTRQWRGARILDALGTAIGEVLGAALRGLGR
jgi:hypothetical protein